MDMTVSFWMDDKDMAELVELTELRNALNAAEGRAHDMDWTVEAVAQNLLTCHFYQLVKKSATLYRSLLEDYKKAEDVPTPALSPDEPEQKPETVSNAEELPHVETLIPFGEPKEEPETLIPIIDASGVRRMATLDEVEAMREAAQGIYEGRTPEPTEETETLVPVIDALGARRMVTPDGLKMMSDAADVYHIVDGDGVILETVETNLYTTALEWRDITAERLGVDSDMLDIMTAEEYESEWGDGEEEEPETESNAEELPAVRRGPLMSDKSDLYFYYLEHGELPPDYSPDDFSNDRETETPARLRDVLFADALYEALYA